MPANIPPPQGKSLMSLSISTGNVCDKKLILGQKKFAWLKKFLGQTIFLGWKLLVLKFFESKNIRTLDNAWGSGFLNFWKFEPYFVLISYLNFYQFKGMFLFFFLISGVLGYIFLISKIFYKSMLLRAWKLTMYCKIWPIL